MRRVYDFYGSRDPDLQRVSQRVASAASRAFTRRESSYIGEYYLSGFGETLELSVESNELDDDGWRHFQWKEYADYPSILVAKLILTDPDQSQSPLDELREQLANVDDVLFLGHEEPRPGAPGPKTPPS
jgi:hypothetical protein